MEENKNSDKTIASQNYSESMNTRYCITRRYNLTFGEAVENVKNQLQKAGFDVISELNVKEYLSSKMENMPAHTILMVCERDTASNLIANDIQMSILFPCNVTVKSVENGTAVEVSVEDTSTTWSASLKSDVKEIAKKTKDALEELLDTIEQTNIKL